MFFNKAVAYQNAPCVHMCSLKIAVTRLLLRDRHGNAMFILFAITSLQYKVVNGVFIENNASILMKMVLTELIEGTQRGNIQTLPNDRFKRTDYKYTASISCSIFCFLLLGTHIYFLRTIIKLNYHSSTIKIISSPSCFTRQAYQIFTLILIFFHIILY